MTPRRDEQSRERGAKTDRRITLEWVAVAVVFLVVVVGLVVVFGDSFGSDVTRPVGGHGG